MGISPGGRGSASPKTITYDYCDETGKLLFQVVRQEPGRNGRSKDIYQRQPNGKGGWTNNLKGVRLVPYRLPEILKQDPGRLLFTVEGEKCVDALWSIDVPATTNPQGAGKWRDEFSEHLRGRHVVILPDADKPGYKHAEDVARSLNGIAASVHILELPGLPHKGDVVDWFDAGGDKDKLIQLAVEAVQLSNEGESLSRDDKPSKSPAAAAKQDGGDVKARPTTATRLVNLAIESGAVWFHDPEHKAYATIPTDDHVETMPLRSNAFKRWLGRLLYITDGRAAGNHAVQDAITLLEGEACHRGEEHTVHVRLAGYGDKIYLDLADKDRRVVEIDAAGWRIADGAPVRFRRPKGLLPLPLPERGGRFDELRRFVNVADDADWRLLIAWTIAALRPRGPYPILCLNGQQGSSKSTVARMVRSLTDPNSAPLRSEPKEQRDLMIAANNSWTIAFDNLSTIPPWLSDALCCMSTGGGFSTRELYANDEETIFSATRPVLLTSIEDLATRGDLLDRAILLSLPPIPDDRRLQERILWSDFEIARPRILGALLDALSGALRELPRVQLDRLPRMADFAELAVAVEMALDWPAGSFLDAYGENRNEANEVALEASSLVPFVRQFVEAKGAWCGTASELFAELKTLAGEAAKAKDWPGNARGLSGRLKRLAPNLRAAGIFVEWDRANGGNRTRVIRVARQPDSKRDFASQPSHDAKNPGENGIPPDAKGRKPDGRDASGDASNHAKTARGDARDGRDAKSPSLSTRQPGDPGYTPFEEETDL